MKKDDVDKVWDKFPVDDEPLTPEELEQLERARKDKERTSLEELKRELGFDKKPKE